ncbi:MAG: cell division topological specificity factor MinE [Epsilonproteobacteria bacterium]|nr:cell division topological specificity factor MinE [Campylobacterota bacterium]
MTLFEKWFGKKEESSANKARERLKLVLAHERTNTHFPFMDDLRRDMIEVIQKYLKVEDISIKTDRSRELNIDMLEVEVSVGKDVKKETNTTDNS